MLLNNQWVKKKKIKKYLGDFLGGAMVKNMPANAGGTGRSHMLQTN